MKEQDAAHSFEKKEDAIIDKFIDVIENRHFLEEFAPGGCWKIKEGMEEEHNAISEVRELIDEYASELTRLRSELQQERELRKELVGYVVAYHGLSSLTSDEDIYIRSLIEKAKN